MTRLYEVVGPQNSGNRNGCIGKAGDDVKDFSLYLDKKPGAFAWNGTWPPGETVISAIRKGCKTGFLVKTVGFNGTPFPWFHWCTSGSKARQNRAPG